MTVEPNYKYAPVYCFTSDMDWASKAALEIQQAIYDKHEIKATYFVTHKSGLIDQWRKAGKIETGIHPNFLKGSSHGKTYDEVIDSVFRFAPGARCFRAHRCFDNAIITEMLAKRGILFDSNLITDCQQDIAPLKHESGIVRFPCFWEDGIHFKWNRNWDFSQFTRQFSQPGIKIISAHPMITAMNVTSAAAWADLKIKFPPDKWIRMSEAQIKSNTFPGMGPASFLDEMIRFVRSNKFTIMTMEELFQNFGN